jgi:hypothetical protein
LSFLKQPEGTAHVSILDSSSAPSLTPPKTRMGVVWKTLILQLPKNQNQGFVINKIKYPSHKIGMHRLGSTWATKAQLQSLKPSQCTSSLEAWSRGSLVNLSLRKYNL